MDEKILIKGKYSKKRTVILLVGMIVLFFLAFSEVNKQAREMYDMQVQLSMYGWELEYSTYTAYLLAGWPAFVLQLLIPSAVLFAGPAIIIAALLVYMANAELVVTSKRIYGKIPFGKRKNVPMDAIVSVGTAFPQKLIFSTISGQVVFSMMSNTKEIYETVSELLIERQK